MRALPPWLRVHPIAFLPMAVLMPVAYLLLTPLGLFTLDSSSWETRDSLRLHAHRLQILVAAEGRLIAEGPAVLRRTFSPQKSGFCTPRNSIKFPGAREGLVKAAAERAVRSLQEELVQSIASAEGLPMLDRVPRFDVPQSDESLHSATMNAFATAGGSTMSDHGVRVVLPRVIAMEEPRICETRRGVARGELRLGDVLLPNPRAPTPRTRSTARI